MRFILASVTLGLGLSTSSVFAQTLNCPNVGRITINQDTARIVYSDKMGFTDKNDTAPLISVSGIRSVYQAQKWGALITIPTELLKGATLTATIGFLPGDSAE